MRLHSLQVLSLMEILKGTRLISYSLFSIPYSLNCRHCVRRITGGYKRKKNNTYHK